MSGVWGQYLHRPSEHSEHKKPLNPAVDSMCSIPGSNSLSNFLKKIISTFDTSSDLPIT